jgi:hypothetical protein
LPSSDEIDLKNFKDSSYSSDEEESRGSTVTLENTVKEIIEQNQRSKWRKGFACQKTQGVSFYHYFFSS